MKILLYGATGMVGQSVLRECLRDPGVERVLSVGRRATGLADPKLEERVLADLQDCTSLAADVSDVDACLFCLGVSSIGMSEEAYRAVTHDLTLAVAQALARINSQMTFVYVTGAGTDSTERGPQMWARVKGATENDLMRLPFKAVYMFRPGLIQPMHALRHKSAPYRAAFVLATPLFMLLRWWAPGRVTTSERIGQAMLAVARNGASGPLIETVDINALAGAQQAQRQAAGRPPENP